MGKGRPRKPVAELKIAGTYREARHGGGIDETKLAAGLERPTDLSVDGGVLWEHLAPEMVDRGIVKQMDTAMFVGMCEWWGRYRQAQRRLDSLNFATASGTEMNQLVAVASAAWKQFSAAASKFGLTPSDRTKLRPGENEAADEFDKFLKKA